MGCAGHCAKDCHLPFLRTKTVQEERRDRLCERTAVLTKERILTKEDWQHDRSLGQQLRTLRDVEREARKEELAKKKQREREQKEGLWLKTPNGHDREKHDREKLQQTKLARPKQPAKQ